MVAVGGVAPVRYLQNIESKLGLYVRQRILLVGNRVAILLFQFWVQDRYRAIGAHAVTVVVGGVVSQRAEGKRIVVEVLGIAQQSQDKVSAPHIVRQVAEEKTSVRVVAHVLDNGSAVGIAVCFFNFFPGRIGETL